MGAKKIKRPVGFIELGEWFGYPECCIADFLGFVLAHMKGEEPKREVRKLNGTGYVPCPTCNKKTEKELRAVINSNRKEPLPFPQQSEG